MHIIQKRIRFNSISKNLHSQKDDPVPEKDKMKSYKLNS